MLSGVSLVASTYVSHEEPTSIRHDLDHGKEKEVAKKKTRVAEVFETYSGKKSPEECGPQEFLGTHVRILGGLIKLLEGLE